MESIFVNKEGDYKNETISSVPIGINNIIIDNNKNFDLKKDQISNIKPMLSKNPNTIIIPDGKKVKIKPSLNKKVPSNTFSMMANPKKNMGGVSSDEDRTVTSSENSMESESDQILTNNSKLSVSNEEDSEDDYSSIDSGRQKSKSRNTQNSDVSSEYEDDDDDDDDDEVSELSAPKKTYEEIQQEKQQLLFNLERLQKQGYPPSKKYSMASSYEDMKFEFERLKKQRDVEKSIKFSRKILMAFVSGVEFLNGKFDYFDIKLEGWSENVMENVNDYDEVFEELHEKYGESVKMAPELKLLALVSSSAFMFHLTNSLFKTASPKMGDILKQNPDIMRNIAEAAAKNMGNTIDKEFGQDDILGNIMKSGMSMKMNNPKGPSAFPSRPGGGSQPRMNGPMGVDELLNELNSGNTKDDASVSSSGSVNMRSSAKRTKAGKKGIQLDIR